MAHGPTHVDSQRLPKPLGRHSRLPIDFRWKLDGSLVDLEADGYTVQVYVTNPEGNTTGPHATSVVDSNARYLLTAADLAVASPSSTSNAEVVAVADNGVHTLVSDIREIPVGHWGGSDEYPPE
jgi:hypothetical protein